MATIITLSGLVNDELEIVKHEASPFGFFIKIGNELYDVDLTLHKVTEIRGTCCTTECECFGCDDDDTNHISTFVNVQGHVLDTDYLGKE